MQPFSFSGLVVFGDGLSDMGQWGQLTQRQYPPASLGFFEGRWTNGKVWIEQVAATWQLPLSLQNNLAMGGATTWHYNINEPLRQQLQIEANVSLTGMLTQVQQYIEQNPTIDANTLCVLWAGGHDFGNYLEYQYPDIVANPPAENYRQCITHLIAAGAKHIFVGNMPNMGDTPVYSGTEQATKASNLCQQLNETLKALSDSFEDRAHIYLYDSAAIFTKIIADPTRYGFQFTNAYLPYEAIDFNQPLAIREVHIPNQSNGLHPDQFMNWWAVSASAAMHNIIAKDVLSFMQTKTTQL